MSYASLLAHGSYAHRHRTGLCTDQNSTLPTLIAIEYARNTDRLLILFGKGQACGGKTRLRALCDRIEKGAC